MLDLYRVDFYQGDTSAANYGQTAHSLVDAQDDRKIIDLSISAEKLSGVSNYTREPVRIEFSCFLTDWMGDHLLRGEYEHERYICKYEARVWRNGQTIFMGVIDASRLRYDVATDIIKITCYDKIRLLAVFNDQTHFYSILSGYEPGWILGYYLQDISNRIPISTSWIDHLTLPELPQTDLELASVDYSDLGPAIGPWPCHGWLLSEAANVVTFCFAYAYVQENIFSRYKGVYRARVRRYYNGICAQWIDEEFDEETDWTTSLETQDKLAEMFDWLGEHGCSETQVRYGLQPSVTLNGNTYSVTHDPGESVTALFSGNALPPVIHPGPMYTEGTDERANSLKVLQAMLMMYNAVIYSTNASNLVLCNKPSGAAGTPIEIADEHVVSRVSTRANQETPDTSVLEVLAGDTSILQGLVADWLARYHAGKLQVELTIAPLDAYDLHLFDQIEIRRMAYEIVSCQRNLQADEYRIKGWVI